MRRALIIAIPFLLAVPVVYGIAFLLAGKEFQLAPFAVGAAGWLVALLLRTPVALTAQQLTASRDRTQTWVTASSGPLEEGTRLIALAFAGWDPLAALWLGLGWASIEVLYTIANGFALSALSERTDEEAERVRALLPEAALTGDAAWWGVLERAWASAVHIGFSLLLAVSPILVLLTAPLHSAINLVFPVAARHYPMRVASLGGVAVGAILLAAGWAVAF